MEPTCAPAGELRRQRACHHVLIGHDYGYYYNYDYYDPEEKSLTISSIPVTLLALESHPLSLSLPPYMSVLYVCVFLLVCQCLSML